MNDIRGYFLSIVAAALISAVAKRLLGDKGAPAAVGKLLTGLVLTSTVLSPLINWNLSGMNGLMDTYSYDAQQILQAGTQISADALSDSIKEKVETYILDKARQYNADLTVEITLTEESIPKPKSIAIRGSISPYAKNMIQNMIQTDLGVDKEHQIWT